MPRIQQHVFLAFEIRGKNLKPENTNPILHKFYHLLNGLKFARGNIKIVTVDKDPAVLQQMDSSWLKGSIHLNMEVINYPGMGHTVTGLDHETKAFILRELQKLKVEEGKIQINVLETTFSESYREFPSVWPQGEIPVVGF